MSALALDGQLQSFVESMPRDAGALEDYMATFLTEQVSLGQLLTVAAEREAEGQLNNLARTVTTKVLATKAGSQKLDQNEGGALDMIIGGLSRGLPIVRAEAAKAVGRAVESGCAKTWPFQIAESLGVAVVDDDVTVSDAACAAVAALAGNMRGAADAALAKAKAVATTPTQRLRYCDAGVRAVMRGSEIALTDDLVALALANDDPLLQLTALELVAKLGHSKIGAMALLQRVDAILDLAEQQSKEDDFVHVGDHAVAALGAVLATAARTFGPDEWLQVPIPRFLGLALGKLQDLNVAALDAVGAIASTDRGLDLVLDDPNIATNWLSLTSEDGRPAEDADLVRRHRLASFATAMSDRLWQRLDVTGTLLPKFVFASPRDPKVQIEAVNLLAVATKQAPSAATDLAAAPGFYEWLVNDDQDDPRMTNDQLRAKFHCLEAIYDAKPFNPTTQGHLQYLIQLGPFRPRKGGHIPPKVAVAERAA